MIPQDGSPPRSETPSRRATYDSTLVGPSGATTSSSSQASSSTRPRALKPVPPSNFFSSSSSSSSSTIQRSTTSERSTLPEPDEIVDDSEEEEEREIFVRAAPRPKSRSRPSTRSAKNASKTRPRRSTIEATVSSTPVLAKKKNSSTDQNWQVHLETSSSPSTALQTPLPPTSPPAHSDQPAPAPVPAPAPIPTPVLASAPSQSPPASTPTPPNRKTGSAQPECGDDGRWSTPRLLAKEGEGGSKAGIWNWEAYSCAVEETPKDSKYKPMGEWISQSKVGENGAETGVLEEGNAGIEGNNEEPRKGFKTITKDELDKIRPHPNLFFCRETASWCLFSKLPSTLLTTEAKTVQLWRFELMEHYREELRPHESIHRALFEHLEPALPEPILPSDHLSLRTVPHHTFPPRNHPSLSWLKLSWAQSTTNNRLLFSTQEFYPSVLGKELWHSLLKTRGENPQIGQTPAQAEASSINLIWRALDDLLFRGETRALPINGRTFRKSMPWDDISCDVFLSVLGYELSSDGELISAPTIDHRSPTGQANRKRLLRAWLELGIWLEDHSARTGDISMKRETRIKLTSGKSQMVEIVGGDDLTKIDAAQLWTPVASSSRSLTALTQAPRIDPLASTYSALGCTPDLSDESILRVYEAQMSCWPENSPNFLEALLKISNARSSENLSTKVVLERSKGLCTRSEIDQAYSELRLQRPVGGYDRVPDDEVGSAFTKRLEEVTHPERRNVLKEACKLIAAHRKNDFLQTILLSLDDAEGGDGMLGIETEKMSAEKAYKALEVDRGMDDETVLMVYQVRLGDAKDDNEKNKMRTALRVVSEERQSDRLQAVARAEKAADATDGWQLPHSIARNLPVGLTNIANTCYLNSLLQYFFTVRELRDAVLAFKPTDHPIPIDQIRVGGRLVTKSEIERSRRFVLLLQALFKQLTDSRMPAVTPETELAYLALVPSKEEHEAQAATEENSHQQAQTSAADEDDLIIFEPNEGTRESTREHLDGSKSPSVLGKRRTDEKDDEVAMSTSAAPASLPAIPRNSSPPDTDDSSLSFDYDAEMTEVSPPPTLSRTSSTTVADPDERNAKRGRSVDHNTPSSLPPVKSLDSAVDVRLPSPRSQTLPAVTTPPPAPPLPPRPHPRPAAPERQQTKKEQLEAEVSSYMAFGRQNDVTECMDNVMFQIEAALKSNAVGEEGEGTDSLLKRIFYGKNCQKLIFRNELNLQDASRTRTQEEPFFSLLVDVPPTSYDRDIYDGLDAVFDDAPVEIDGKSTRRTVSLLDLPPVLQIQLQRVQYDREKGRIFKSNAHLRFPEELNLARYLNVDELAPDVYAKRGLANTFRREIETARTKLVDLDHNVDQPRQLKDALDHLTIASSELGDLLPPSLPEDTAMEAQDIERDIVALREHIEIARRETLLIWKPAPENEYELRAVFIHRGTASSGHYFIYQRDSKNPQRWLKYNDSIITEVNRDEIFRETMSDTNAYFLVYCRKDRLDAIETIERTAA